jgi:hypothetical protein
MNYKQDREFIDRVLDAQMRVTQIEKSIKKKKSSL